jgi:phosphate starvation-inducible PhoH-like protein
LTGVASIATVRFNAEDVVRHPLVTKIVTAYDAYEAKRRGDAKPARPK